MIKKIFDLVPKELNLSMIWMITLFIFASLFEALGVAMVLPLINQLTGNDDISLNFLNDLILYLNKFFVFENQVILILITIFITFTLKNIILLHQIRFQNSFVFKVFIKLSTKLLKIYLSQNYLFHVKKKSSNLIRNVSTDLLLYQSALLNLLTLISKTFIVVGILILMLKIDLFATIFISIFILIILFIFNLLTKDKVNKLGKKRYIYSSKWIENLQQALSSVNILKVFNAENYFINSYNYSISKLGDASRKHDNIQAYPRIIFELIVLLVFTLFFIYIVFKGYDYANIFTLISFYFISALKIAPPILHIYRSFITINFAKKTIDSLSKELKLKIKSKKIEKYPIIFKKNIKLNNVSFKYENSKYKNLESINLVINKNEFIGIVGPSGSGKTTLINILIGLIKPNSGYLTVDGKRLNTDNSEWVKKISYVPQITFLLDSSIKENIAFAKKNFQFDEKKIDNLLKIVQLKKFVSNLPNKINTDVGERGSKISEGQKQRIGIARALYKDPEILILDEITSSLDANTENKIVNDINKMKGKKTILFISHKKNILDKCDKIIEVKNGKAKIFKNK